MRRVGVLGGSFDPVHNGHLRLAEDAHKELALDEVILIPARRQPLKDGVHATPEQRLTMCRLAAEGRPFLTVSDLEARREGPSYTVDTMAALHAQGGRAKWFFLAGSDTVAALTEWREPERLLTLCSIAVVERGGVTWEDLQSRLPNHLLPGLLRLRAVAIEVSSTVVRGRLSRGRSVTGLVPDAVEQYIRDHNLYRR